ncbi:glucoamylase family protein [Desulfosporosinus sp. PR]|uniref:GH36-type glycosyl hydrolase domain-containing protein n=1 Tax=Candidatus Desulfosporosinus nitrosoreducens TaxID=3401928 RepID=UPI0027FF3CD9|nr:glucoamylase family protein [Desulfosporosinus sp. PR]MDQ7094981.1 glucoamylase family protein [Desulfosporosinus sp. PR]
MKFFARPMIQEKPYKDIALHGEDLLKHAEEIAHLTSNQSIHFPKRTLLPRVRQNIKFLERAYHEITDYSARTKDTVPATEWLLDNYYSLRGLKEEIPRSLPPKFERQLPRNSSGDFIGYPRVYGLLVELIEHTDSQLQRDTLKAFINAYQVQIPLTSGELWAIPTMLRIVILENIRRLTELILFTQEERERADHWLLPLLENDHDKTNWDEILKTLIPQEEYSSAYAEQILRRMREHGVEGAPLLHWIDRAIAKQDTTIEELAKLERQHQTMYQVSMGHAISGIHFIAAEDWPRFFEEVSLVESVFEKDPSQVYCQMDFDSRDAYRHEVEKIARQFKISELVVARRVLTRAEEARQRGDLLAAHVGRDLLGSGRAELEQELRQDFGTNSSLLYRFRQAMRKKPELYYFGSLLIVTLVLSALVLAYAGNALSFPLLYAVLFLGVLIWASSLTMPTLNWIVSKLFVPTFLPKFEMRDGIPEEFRTMVVVPTLLTSVERVKELIGEIEVYFLANRDNNLYFALLGDFADAPAQTVSGDDEILTAATEAIEHLNRKYEQDRFYFFHRLRLFNPSEGVWMGWERKRGKLAEFNALLRQEGETSYNVKIGNLTILPSIRYVITLDADTKLPQGTAKKLIGALAHPLNSPRLNEEKTRVVQGYGVLQPRVGVSILSAGASEFAQIYSGRVGVDPYTTAISDLYQDLFSEGIFTGKGIYDVEVFHQVTHQTFPENTILSHDLIEGIYARAGLVTDIELVDGYPSTYRSYLRRQHRWVRGDWQLIPWLFKPISFVSKWKIFDNLRRSLENPAQLLLLTLGFSFLPGSPWVWTGLVALSILWPMVLCMLNMLLTKGGERGEAAQDALTVAKQFALQFILLPRQAFSMLDAILRSCYRQLISHQKMLEWETAADTEKRIDISFKATLRSMWSVIVYIIFLGFFVGFLFPARLTSVIPLGILWLLAIWYAYRVSLPKQLKKDLLSFSEQLALRLWARKIWAFFEEFVNDTEHWLPPDNVQIDPPNGVAHRTSPTNIGLALLGNIAARDFGYISLTTALQRIEKMLLTVKKLEHWQGHLYNWYDTQSLEPLEPRYISTVDSGNFVLYLLTLKAGLAESLEKPLVGLEYVFALQDTCTLLKQAVGEEGFKELAGFEKAIQNALENPAKDWNFRTWMNILLSWPQNYSGQEWAEDGKYWGRCLEGMICAFKEEIQDYFPWANESNLTETETLESMSGFKFFNLSELGQHYSQALEKGNFSAEISEKIHAALLKLRKTIRTTQMLQQWLEEMVLATDFHPLFDEKRQLFSIGYRIGESMLDKSYYDLLASEARQASFIAIAKGDVPHSHWFRLGRSLTLAQGKRSLVSWSGTMFEFLMPLLVMKNYAGTLLDETYKSVVEVQKKYAAEHNLPWGISESGFYAFDPQLNYQYKAFGVPGLGLKRGLIQDLVIAPYASFLALMVSPREALDNISLMEHRGFGGRYGLYEAVDFTADRIPVGKSYRLIQSFMAHHQGMSFLALDNILFDNRMQTRLHSEALIQAMELLLQERIPSSAPLVSQPEGEQIISGRHVKSTPPEKNQSIFMNTAMSPIPVTHCISNGQYSVMLTNSGAGFSRYREIGLTRWREDVTRDAWGMYFYIQNLNSGDVWSATHQPCLNSGDDYKVTYAPDRVEYFRKDGNLATRTEIVVSPEDQAEIRRISLTNHSKFERIIEITSYFEVVLARANDDLAHPAFGNLFIQTDYQNEALFASRRPRKENQRRLWLMHTVATEGDTVGTLQYETDRARFIGRGRSLSKPQVLDANHPLSNTVGAVLDPIMSLRQRVRVAPGQTARVSFSVGYADNQEEIIRISEKYRDPLSVNRAFELAWTHCKMELRHLNLTAGQANEGLSLGGHLLYLSPCRRDVAEYIANNCKGQSALWPYAISGDLPVVLVRVDKSEHMELVRRLLTIHEYWSLKGLYADLVILNEDESGYVQALQDNLRDLISMGHARDRLNQPGGVFILQKSHVQADDLRLLYTVARIIFNGEGGSCSVQVRKKSKLIIPESAGGENPSSSELEDSLPETSLDNRQLEAEEQIMNQLTFANGYGGFSQDGREYVIKLQEGKNTPLPWINVIANPTFGFQVSEVGAGYTWSDNSREYKLTPWSNDSLLDPTGEALYLRSDDSGEFWSVTAKPRREKGAYTIRHGQGYSIFEHCSHGLKQSLKLFVPLQEPLKLLDLTLSNTTEQEVHLSLVYYVEWVLGVARELTAPYLVTEYDEKSQVFLARNTYQEEFSGRWGFLGVVGAGVASYTGDRSEFIGRNGGLADPAGLKLESFSGSVGAGFDPCAALQVPLTIAAGETRKVTFLLGETTRQEEIGQILALYENSKKVDEEFDKVRQFWNGLLSKIQVETPDTSMNLLMNCWLLYQTTVCRLWARSAFYQSGGAYGFRDQLQDVMALVYTSPEVSRKQILLHCGHQFKEGDVQHWWHEGRNKGIRTKFSDDLLWLPYVTAHYIEHTGDSSVLDEMAPFLEDELLREGEDERYSVPKVSSESGDVYEHCLRAIEKGLSFGEHGLPLIGSGDWNDGFSQIGPQGRGESVWLGWFLYLTLMRFSSICQARQDKERAERYRRVAEELQQNLEKYGWDGGWYRRAYFDDGTPLGSTLNTECQIDAIAQSWSVLSGGARPTRAQDAMLALEHYLWRKEDGVLLLLTPPFDKSLPDPGYIKGYVPGVRENGGQYTHGAIWAISAYTTLGEGDKAMELFHMLNPVNHARTEHEANRYKVEPYVVAADVYAIHPHVGRGGWTWYTGAAGWLYQAGLEGILGFKRQGDKLVLKPCLPSHWKSYKLVYHYCSSKYEIVVDNPKGRMTGFEQLTCDGEPLQEPVISLQDDGQTHSVRLTL